MNYSLHYKKLINTRKILVRNKKMHIYYENHHIIPKCLGGTNNKDNLILLTAKEHFIAHLLLTQIYTGKIKAKMCYAFLRMCTSNKNNKRQFSSSQYELAKKMLSDSCKGKNNPFYGMIPWNKGQKLSEEHKQKVRESLLGKTLTKKHKENISKGSNPWNKGQKLSEEHKQKVRESLYDKSKGNVIEYSLDGIILNIYSCIGEASYKTGNRAELILKCCEKKKNYTVGRIKYKNPVVFRFECDSFDYIPCKYKMTDIHKCKLSKPKSKEHKKKLKEAWKKRKRRKNNNIICLNDKKIYKNAREASNILNLSYNDIKKVLLNKLKDINGYYFKRIE